MAGFHVRTIQLGAGSMLTNGEDTTTDFVGNDSVNYWAALGWLVR